MPLPSLTSVPTSRSISRPCKTMQIQVWRTIYMLSNSPTPKKRKKKKKGKYMIIIPRKYEREKYTNIIQIYHITCLKSVKLRFPSLLSHLSTAWQANSMSRKHVTGSLFIANTMSPCSNRFSAFDPAKHPLTRKTWRRIGSFFTRAYITKQVKF